MKNQEFKIDTKSGVVVFCQKSHGRVFTSKSKADSIENFNIGIGQLIAMKRNEIKIRKVDIESMQKVVSECQTKAKENKGTTASKLYANFVQMAMDKVKMSYNHIRELKEDLDRLYNGTYIVKPYAEILADHKKVRNGTAEDKEDVFKHPYAVPQEIVDGTHIFDVVNGSAVIKPIHDFSE